MPRDIKSLSNFVFEILCSKYRWSDRKMAGSLWHTDFEAMKIVAVRVRQSWDVEDQFIE